MLIKIFNYSDASEYINLILNNVFLCQQLHPVRDSWTFNDLLKSLFTAWIPNKALTIRQICNDVVQNP